MPHSLEDLNQAFTYMQANGYSFWATCYNFNDGKITITLEKVTSGKATVKVEGSGANIYEAVAEALGNFPTNPLDGSKWKNNQLAAPKEIIIEENGEPIDPTPPSSLDDEIPY